MRKLIIVLIVVGVIAAAVAVLIFNLNGIVNKNKDFLIQRAETAVGRDIEVGRIGVTLRGGLGIRLEDVRVADDPEFSNEPFVEASDLQVNAKLLPLLRRKFEVKRVILRRPVIRIVRSTAGEFNFMSLTAAGGAAGGGAESGAGAGGTESGGAAAVPLVVSLASIEDGEIDYTDRTNSTSIHLTQIESSVENLDLEKPISTEIEAALLSDSKNLKINATVGPLGTGQPNALDVPVDLHLELDPINTAAVFGSFPDIKKKLPADYAVSGSALLKLDAKGTAEDAAIEFDIDGTQLDIRGPQGFEKKSGVQLSAVGNSRYTKDGLELAGVDLEFGPLKATIKGRFSPGPPPLVDVDIESQKIGLGGWGSIVPMVETYALTGSAEVSAHVEGTLEPGRVPALEGTAKIIDAGATLPQYPKPVTAVTADINFQQNKAEIPAFSLRIGESTIKGNATVSDFQKPGVSYSATSRSIALADIQPPKPNIKKPEILRDVSAQGRLNIGEQPEGNGKLTSQSGTVADLDYKNLSAAYAIAGRQITISDMAAQTLGGRVTGGGTITTGEQSTAFDIHAKANDVNLTEMFDAIPGDVRRSLKGRANLDINVSGSGNEWKDIKHTLSGDGLAELIDGEIIDWNISKSFFDEIDQFAGANIVTQQIKAKYPKVFTGPNTSFEDLKSDFVIKDGSILARNLQLKHDDYAIKGKGSLSFDGGLSFQATFVASKALTSDLIAQHNAVKYLADAQGRIEVPLELTGTLPRISAKPDSDYLRSVMSKAFTEQGLDILKKKNLQDLLPFGKKSESKPDSTKKQ